MQIITIMDIFVHKIVQEVIKVNLIFDLFYLYK